VERDTELEDCVIFDGATVTAGTSYRKTIVLRTGVVAVEDNHDER
jgi:hypothetical protein